MEERERERRGGTGRQGERGTDSEFTFDESFSAAQSSLYFSSHPAYLTTMFPRVLGFTSCMSSSTTATGGEGRRESDSPRAGGAEHVKRSSAATEQQSLLLIHAGFGLERVVTEGQRCRRQHNEHNVLPL